MNLFDQTYPFKLLPYQGEVNYYGKIFSHEASQDYADKLFKQIDWKHDEAKMYGKHFITKRKVAWHGDVPFTYTYSNTTKLALPWTNELLCIKKNVEQISQASYNACLLNLYHDGQEGMAWHSDDEKALAFQAPIASVSFGAERKFAFKHKQSNEVVSIILENGSLLVMAGETQTYWKHRLPPTSKVNKPRINLTFRTMLTV
ncbi:MAG: alpha-ketoglutarate-dependent dioxygenase AlkB [Chitinophagaceae bacterium]|nr:alpha-ketoglutarate-dependent dioxygenase AlkB [Chitinophagaceae bacterium]